MLFAYARGTHAQGYLPLSRAVESPFAAAVHQRAAGFHAAIRPYLEEEVLALPGADTLRPKAALAFLDRWAMDSVAWKVRGGPLIEALIGAPMGEKESTVHRASAGFWLDARVHPSVTLHADAQVWNESLPGYLDTLVAGTMVSLGEGLALRDTADRFERAPYTHHDWNAYADWKTAKYFRLTLGRGKHFIGEGHRSLLLSDAATSYPYFKITTTAWHIRYVNLFTMLNDVRGSYGDPAGFQRKYASFHYLSWNASKRLNLGVFESIIWSAGDSAYPRGFDINYLNPVVVFRPQEFAQGSADNALLGLQASMKIGGRTLAYGQFMLDEFLLREVRAGKGWFANKQGFQLGISSFDAFKVKGLFLRLELDYVRPFMYTHSDTRQNYSHFGQPLAHPYGSNFSEWIGQVAYTKDRWAWQWHVSTALLGGDTGVYSSGNNIFRPESDRIPAGYGKLYGYYVGDDRATRLFFSDLSASWSIDPRTGLCVEAGYLFRSRVPEVGENHITHFFRLGIVCRFREHYRDQEMRYMLE